MAENDGFDMQPIESDNLASIGFNAETKQIRIEFKSGFTYEYDNCTEAEYQNIVNAPSPNGALAVELRYSGKPYRRV